jgi:hypothetical protein
LGREGTNSIKEAAESSQSNTLDETIIDQQSSLWGASSGIEWQGNALYFNTSIYYRLTCFIL